MFQLFTRIYVKNKVSLMEEELELFLLSCYQIPAKDIDPDRTCRNSTDLTGICRTAPGIKDEIPWDPHGAGFFS